MIAGPQIITPFFLAMSENWRKNSAAFLGGALLAVTFFVTLAYVVGCCITPWASPTSRVPIRGSPSRS
jgi:hypothetical protein